MPQPRLKLLPLLGFDTLPLTFYRHGMKMPMVACASWSVLGWRIQSFIAPKSE
jgi:hypothetical protein